jgi:hypothetical protein
MALGTLALDQFLASSGRQLNRRAASLPVHWCNNKQTGKYR